MKNAHKNILDLIVKKSLGELEEEIAFSSNIFMLYGLPARRVPGNPAFWEKETALCKFTISRHSKYEVPSGCYARMNQIFIDTEVRTKNTNVIDVGRSFRQYTHKLGYKDGKANKALLRQLINYITCKITIEPLKQTENRVLGVNTLIAKAWDIFFDVKNPEQLMLSKGEIVLDESYAKYIHDHSVPLDMNVIRCFKRNPLALDFYRYLAYRNNGLNKTISFKDHFLFEQLGTEQSEDKKTRNRLNKILKDIQLYWPVKAKFEDGYFEFMPSPPAVRKKIASVQALQIAGESCG